MSSLQVTCSRVFATWVAFAILFFAASRAEANYPESCATFYCEDVYVPGTPPPPFPVYTAPPSSDPWNPPSGGGDPGAANPVPFEIQWECVDSGGNRLFQPLPIDGFRKDSFINAYNPDGQLLYWMNFMPDQIPRRCATWLQYADIYYEKMEALIDKWGVWDVIHQSEMSDFFPSQMPDRDYNDLMQTWISQNVPIEEVALVRGYFQAMWTMLASAGVCLQDRCRSLRFSCDFSQITGAMQLCSHPANPPPRP